MNFSDYNLDSPLKFRRVYKIIGSSKSFSGFATKIYRVSCLIVFIFSILLFSSCNKKKSEESSVHVFSLFNKNVPEYVLLNEARYSDLPVPIGFRHIKKSNSNDQHISIPPLGCGSDQNKSDFLSYQGDLALSQTLEFYYKALEREGWQIVDLSNDHEGLLFCSKPTKQCIVSLRRFKKNKTKVYLFVKNKLDELKIVDDINSKNVAELKQAEI